MRKYHLVLTDGTEKDYMADYFSVTNSGALILYVNDKGTVAFSKGAWSAVETEVRDDR